MDQAIQADTATNSESLDLASGIFTYIDLPVNSILFQGFIL